MTTYYAPCTVQPGESIAWRVMNAKRGEYRFGECNCEGRACSNEQELHVIDLASFGDYDNSTAVERSNHRVLVRDHGDVLVQVIGSYNSQAIGYFGDLDAQSEELRDAIAALDSYPILDEQDEGELETEMGWEGWCDWGRRDFARDLVAVLDAIDPAREHEIDVPHEESDTTRKHAERAPITRALDDVWHRGCDAFNVNGGTGFAIEAGGRAHFYIDEWCKRVVREPGGSRATFEIREMLLAIAHSCGTIKPGVDATLDERVRLALCSITLGIAGVIAPVGLIAACATDVSAYEVLADYLRGECPCEIGGAAA